MVPQVRGSGLGPLERGPARGAQIWRSRRELAATTTLDMVMTASLLAHLRVWSQRATISQVSAGADGRDGDAVKNCDVRIPPDRCRTECQGGA